MLIFNRRFAGLLFLLLFICASILTHAQSTGYVQINGKIKKSNKPVGGVTVQITGSGITPMTVVSKENGSFNFNLDLQKNYTIKFSMTGSVSKLIEFNTKLPPDQADIIFEYPFNIDLFDDLAEVSSKEAMIKPVARIAYNPTYENFMDDENYTKQMKAEQDAARRAAEDLHRQRERARLDSLNRIWNDSLAKIKTSEASLAAQRAEQERLKREQEKARKDSLDRANIAAQEAAASAAREKARLDMAAIAAANAKALAESYEKARRDSISKAEAEMARLEQQRLAREKASQDSLARVSAEKNRQDSLAEVRATAAAKLKLEEDARVREKARVDSIAQADAAFKSRQKFVADSIAQAKLDSDRQSQREEALRKEQEKNRLDSIAKAETFRKERKKEFDDSVSSVLATNKIREKFVNDSLSQAKILQDKRSGEERARLDAVAKQKENDERDRQAALALRQKAIADSTERTTTEAKQKKLLDDQERKKRETDSIAQAKEDGIRLAREAEERNRLNAMREKSAQDSIASMLAIQKQKDEAERLRKATDEKNRQDSLFLAQRSQADKEDADRKAKILADVEAQKELFSKANTVEQKSTPAPKTVAPVPKIRDSDYREGVTDETINEAYRVIHRTVVKKEGTTFNYQKVVYNWGGIFYFKNENSITEITFQQEIKNAKAEFK